MDSIIFAACIVLITIEAASRAVGGFRNEHAEVSYKGYA